MTPDGVIAFAQIIPVLYLAVHFTLKGFGALRTVTAVTAAAAELLLLLNIVTGEKPEPIVNWLAFASATLMLVVLTIAALHRIENDGDKKRDQGGDENQRDS